MNREAELGGFQIQKVVTKPKSHESWRREGGESQNLFWAFFFPDTKKKGPVGGTAIKYSENVGISKCHCHVIDGLMWALPQNAMKQTALKYLHSIKSYS